MMIYKFDMEIIKTNSKRYIHIPIDICIKYNLPRSNHLRKPVGIPLVTVISS